MSTEIERKFIVEVLPTNAVSSSIVIRQGYLAEDGDTEVRIRFADETAVLTIKIGRGRSRAEVELDLPAADAEQLWEHTNGRRISKRRSRIRVGARTAELDVYDGALSGLTVVEVEFADEAAADSFDVPEWFGRELTGDPAWSNASLARHGRPSP